MKRRLFSACIIATFTISGCFEQSRENSISSSHSLTSLSPQNAIWSQNSVCHRGRPQHVLYNCCFYQDSSRFQQSKDRPCDSAHDWRELTWSEFSSGKFPSAKSFQPKDMNFWMTSVGIQSLPTTPGELLSDRPLQVQQVETQRNSLSSYVSHSPSSNLMNGAKTSDSNIPSQPFGPAKDAIQDYILYRSRSLRLVNLEQNHGQDGGRHSLSPLDSANELWFRNVELHEPEDLQSSDSKSLATDFEKRELQEVHTGDLTKAYDRRGLLNQVTKCFGRNSETDSVKYPPERSKERLRMPKNDRKRCKTNVKSNKAPSGDISKSAFPLGYGLTCKSFGNSPGVFRSPSEDFNRIWNWIPSIHRNSPFGVLQCKGPYMKGQGLFPPPRAQSTPSPLHSNGATSDLLWSALSSTHGGNLGEHETTRGRAC